MTRNTLLLFGIAFTFSLFGSQAVLGAARTPESVAHLVDETPELSEPLEPDSEKSLGLIRWSEWFVGLSATCLLGLTLVGLTQAGLILPFIFGLGIVLGGVVGLILGAFALAKRPGDERSLRSLSVGLFLATLGGVLLPFLRRDDQ